MKDTLGFDRNLALLLLLSCLLNVGMGAFAPLLPQIMGSLDLSFAEAGLLGTAFGLTRCAINLPVGLLADRIGFTRILHAGMALFVAGTLLSAWAPSFAVMFGARALLGLASGAVNVVAILYLMRTGRTEQRTRRANLYELSVIAGQAVSADAAGLIAGAWGWRWSFWLGTLVFVLSWPLAIRMGAAASRAESAVASKEPEGGVRPARLSAGILAVYVAMFAQAFAWGGGISVLFPLYGGRGLDLSPAAVGRAMSLAFWVEVCLLFPVGWAADAWGKGRILIPGFIAILAGTLLGPLGGAGIYQAGFVLLVSGMSVWMLSPALLTELQGNFGGRSAGVYRLITDFGFIVSPALVGWLIGRYGFTAAAVTIAAVVALAIALVIRFLGVRKSQ